MQTTNIRHCEWAAIAAAFAVAIGHLAARARGLYTPADVENGRACLASTARPVTAPTGTWCRRPTCEKGSSGAARSDEDLMRTISQGVPGTAMNGHNFNPSELGALVAYLRSMRDFGARAVALGDPPAGQALFEGKGMPVVPPHQRAGIAVRRGLQRYRRHPLPEALERALTSTPSPVSCPRGRVSSAPSRADGPRRSKAAV